MSGWSKDVACWIELENGQPSRASLELLGEAAQVAQAQGGQLIGLVVADPADLPRQTLAETLGRYEVDRLEYLTASGLAIYSTEAYCQALTQGLNQIEWGLLLLPASPDGTDLSPRLAARLGLELVSGCIQISLTGPDGLRFTRPLFDNRLHAVYESRANQVLATFEPGARGQSLPGRLRMPELYEQKVTLDTSRIKSRSTGFIPPDPARVDIVEAERIVAVGLGLTYPAGLTLAQQLASQLEAAIGATRPVVDKGWLPFPRQIGTTGRSVTPRLYIALGISGAGQHTGGLKGAGTIISINKDRTAPMMALADLALVGDAAEVLPLLLRKLAARRKTRRVEAEALEAQLETSLVAGRG